MEGGLTVLGYRLGSMGYVVEWIGDSVDGVGGSVAALALWLLGNVYALRVALSPLIVFATTVLLWNIAFSPYGNTARLVAAFSIAVCLQGLRRGRVPDLLEER